MRQREYKDIFFLTFFSFTFQMNKSISFSLSLSKLISHVLTRKRVLFCHTHQLSLFKRSVRGGRATGSL